MKFLLLLLFILLVGLSLVVIGGFVLIMQKGKLAGIITMGTGYLTILASILGFTFLVITTSTIG